MLNWGIVGDLLLVSGALLIFFSWLTTNTLGEKLKRANGAFEGAARDRRLFASLNDAAHSVESSAAQSINVEIAILELSSRLADKGVVDFQTGRLENKLELLRRASKSLNARQIDWGLKACIGVLEESLAFNDVSPARDRLNAVCDKLRELRDEKDRISGEIERVYSGRGKPDAARDEARLHALRTQLRNLIDPGFASLMQAFVDCANERGEELRAEVKVAKHRFKLATRAALVLYVFGTISVISGSLIDKLVKYRATPSLSSNAEGPP